MLRVLRNKPDHVNIDSSFPFGLQAPHMEPYKSNAIPWARGSEVPQLMVLVCRRM